LLHCIASLIGRLGGKRFNTIFGTKRTFGVELEGWCHVVAKASLHPPPILRVQPLVITASFGLANITGE